MGRGALRAATFNPGTELVGEHFDQCIQRFIRLPKSFDFLNRVKNRGVMATIVEPPDPGRAPSSHVLGQVHRNLSAQTGGSLIARDASISEMIGDGGFDLLQ
jgi:hypothetical protein